MLKRGAGTRVFRRVAAALAGVALMGHSLAMLLAVALAPAANASALPAFMEICTPDGIVFLPFDQPLNSDDRKAPDGHDSGGLVDGCPVCAAFGQLNGAAPPAGITLTAACAAAQPPLLRQAAAPQRQTVHLPQSRAPPALG